MLLDVGPEGGKASKIKFISGLAGTFFISLLVVVFLMMVKSSGYLGEASAWAPVVSNSELTTGENLSFSTSVKSFGYGLMTKYMLPLQVSGFLLLAAMVGVIVLSKKDEEGTS
jgi:NADH-quinone oxidoreductase subunit J